MCRRQFPSRQRISLQHLRPCTVSESNFNLKKHENENKDISTEETRKATKRKNKVLSHESFNSSMTVVLGPNLELKRLDHADEQVVHRVVARLGGCAKQISPSVSDDVSSFSGAINCHDRCVLTASVQCRVECTRTA